jgi:hypothetical protein
MAVAARLHALILLFLLSAAISAPSSFGANVVRFTDTRDDACCTEDITNVVFSNDDAGTITFAITAPPNSYGYGSSDRFISITTERAHFVIGTHDGPGYVLSRGWGVSEPPFSTRLRATRRGDVLRVSADRHQLGDTDRFRFDVSYWNVGSMHATSDHAPDAGTWSYDIKLALRRIRPTVSVRQHHHQKLAARLALHVRGSDRLLASGHISCVATVGWRKLRIVKLLFSERQVLCVWAVPRWARGQIVRGRVSVRITRYRGSQKRRSFRRLLA